MNTRSSGLAAQRPMVSGTLSAIPFTDLVLSLDDFISNSVDEYVNKMHSQLVGRMMMDEDWRPLIPYVDVAANGLEVDVAVKHPLATELEYGTPTRPMKPLIRPFVKEASEAMANFITNKTKKEFG